jgi:hypothetical protein
LRAQLVAFCFPIKQPESTNTNLRLTVSVDIKETGVRNIPGRTTTIINDQPLLIIIEQKLLDGDLSAATP